MKAMCEEISLNREGISVIVPVGGGGPVGEGHVQSREADHRVVCSFREAELRTLLEMNGVGGAEMKWSREGDPTGRECAFMEIELPSEVSGRSPGGGKHGRRKRGGGYGAARRCSLWKSGLPDAPFLTL